jgi:hypothetical protein
VYVALPPDGTVPFSEDGVCPLQMLCAELMVLFETAGSTVTVIVLLVLLEHAPEVTTLLKCVVLVIGPGE